jgi:hypothetical protein
MADLWGMDRDDSARRRARVIGIPKRSRGRYAVDRVLEERQARIDAGLIPEDHVPGELAEAAAVAAIA